MKMEYKEKEIGINLLEYWRMIIKRKWVLFTFGGGIILFVGVFTFTASPKYKPEAILLIEEAPSKMLSIENEFGYPGYRSDLGNLRFFNTQLILLKSKTLAERVARKMDLLDRHEFSADKMSKKSLMSKAKDLITFRWLANKKKSKNRASRLLSPYSKIVEELYKHIEVSPIRDTKVIKVSYASSFPILATDIVNTLSDEFIAFSIEKRYEATKQASNFLGDQIINLREDLAAKERELQRYGQEKELFFLSDKETTAISKFADLNEAFTQAQIERIKAEAAYRELNNLDIDSLPQTVENRLIQNLREEYTNMKNEYEEKSKIFKPEYPEMIGLKTKMESMREELKSEIKKAVEAAELQYRSALKKEFSLKALLDKQKADVVEMDSNAILYNSLKIEAENKRKLLNSLEKKQNETLVSERLGGLKTSNISIIDKAKIPQKPVSPKKKLNMILALLMGIFGGVGLCFVFEYLDNTIKTPEDIEKLAGLPSLGIIPYLSPKGKKKDSHKHYSEYIYRGEKCRGGDGLPEIKNIELINHLFPNFSISEDYRTARTSILLSNTVGPPRNIVISSSLPMEGKTATVANMAVAFSQLQERVLIIDTDLRRPNLHRLFKVRNVPGLTGYLTGKFSLDDAVIQKTNIENIWIIPSGLIPPNPTELLNSKEMKILMERVKKEFDVILLDTPPVLAVADTLIISSLADSVILIVQPEKTTRQSFLKTVDELTKAKAKILGVLFNQVKVRKGNYFYLDYYKYYGYREGEEEQLITR